LEATVEKTRVPYAERLAEDRRRMVGTIRRFAALVPDDLGVAFVQALDARHNTLHSWLLSLNCGESLLPAGRPSPPGVPVFPSSI
jgi:hypothetical protein